MCVCVCEVDKVQTSYITSHRQMTSHSSMSIEISELLSLNLSNRDKSHNSLLPPLCWYEGAELLASFASRDLGTLTARYGAERRI